MAVMPGAFSQTWTGRVASGSARGLRPPEVVVDRGDTHYRGGQLRAIADGVARIRLHLEANIVDERTCSAAMFVAGTFPALGAAVCCEVDPADGYAIRRVHDATPMEAALERMWSRDGETFSPGAVPRSLSGTPEAY